jgi:integrase
MANEGAKRARRGGGHLYRPKRKGTEGVVRESAVWWMVYYRNGHRVAESTGTRNRPEASRILNERLNAVGKGEPIDVSRKLTYTDLEQMVRDYYVAKGNKSLRRLEGVLKHLRSYFDGWRASAIDTSGIDSYVAQRMGEPHRQGCGAARATVNNELAALRLAFNLAVGARKLTYAPMIRTPDPRNARKGFIDRGSLESICEHLSGSLAAVVKAAFVTGWRVQSELLTREWRHVDFRAGWLRLEPNESKNSEAREFPITIGSELRNLLEAQLARATQVEKATGRIVPRVFFQPDGKEIKSLQGAWKTACIKAGRAGLILHDLRRSAVRNLESAGVSRSASMRLSGHKTEAVFRRYAIVDQATLRDAEQKLSEFQRAEQKRLATEGPKVMTLPTAQEREPSQAV